ncbi:uncharacterized protein LOC105186650 isoform X2 [Harpegnathos saltator]|uniref:uncharacterized protein LOC105186650 isoform X2 n=1 Tax=Harpegnathos saltator TaxID=610380 RepID=UPI000DBEE673|nr:uncharacterized protein LOC105186650 isoform X2 [Harpegnathos saltator]
MWKINNTEELSSIEMPNRDIKNKKPTILNYIIDYEKPQDHNSKIFLYCWDGNNFFKHSTLVYPKQITDEPQALIGMQFIGRRHNLYICGGEHGLGKGKFNQRIWRYSLISKKWFIDTPMPIPRRHMITVFFKDKLYLVGGVGRYRKQLKSIGIYNIHSRIWTMGAYIPESFTKIPEYCVSDDKLIIYMSQPHLFIYCSIENSWIHLQLSCNDLSKEVILMGFNETICFIDVTNKDVTDNVVIRYIKYETNDKICKSDTNYTCEERYVNSGPDLENTNVYSLKYLKTFIIDFKGNNNKYVWFCHKSSLCSLSFDTICTNFHIHTSPLHESIKFDLLFSSFSSITRKFFNILDPADLYSGSETIT